MIGLRDEQNQILRPRGAGMNTSVPRPGITSRTQGFPTHSRQCTAPSIARSRLVVHLPHQLPNAR